MAQLDHPTAVPTLAPRLERLLSHPEYAVWVAEGDDGALLGLTAGHVVFSIDDEPAAHAFYVRLRYEHTGRRFGR